MCYSRRRELLGKQYFQVRIVSWYFQAQVDHADCAAFRGDTQLSLGKTKCFISK